MAKVILLDFDGPIIDSLGNHIDFCLRMNEKYGGPKMLPPADNLNAWRNLASYPMVNFLINIGFTASRAEYIRDHDYLPEFANQKNPAPLYPGMAELIAKLYAEGCHLGIVSQNLRQNILASIGRLTEHFSIISSNDEFPEKPPALIHAAHTLGIAPDRAVYIGDAPKDYKAACAVGMPFIGVSWGWQITGDEKDFVSAKSPEELEFLLAFME